MQRKARGNIGPSKFLQSAKERLGRHWLPRRLLWRKLLVAIPIAVALYYMALIVTYRFVNPVSSNLILWTTMKGSEIQHNWVPLSRVSKHLIRAVITSEDSRFCTHWGVDWDAIAAAIRTARSSGPAGASTITMQTAKNLFLWQSRSYLRKAIEIPMAYAISFVWPKRRVLEIYLNIAEWAPGVFGVDAAARHHFRTSAAKLSRQQSALLAAALPNPHRRKAGRAGSKTRRKASMIKKRSRSAGRRVACVLVRN